MIITINACIPLAVAYPGAGEIVACRGVLGQDREGNIGEEESGGAGNRGSESIVID